MSNEIFRIKKDTYNIKVKEMQQFLKDGDIQSGLQRCDECIALCSYLISQAEVYLIQNYQQSLKELQSLKKSLMEGKNPFRQGSSKPSNNVPKDDDEEEEEESFFDSGIGKIDKKLDDVAGLQDVKDVITYNVLVPFKDPEFHSYYSSKTGATILLYGPPGCGKSFIAECIAGELGCHYAALDCSEILSKYVGDAPKKVKQIFRESEKYDKCLIFFDEIDSLCSKRGGDEARYTKDILSTFLTCLSGFGTSNRNNTRIVIGATNLPWDLDDALLRGGRFDTQIYISLPDENARKVMIEKKFDGRDFLLASGDLSIDYMTQEFEGYSGADIGAVIAKCIYRAEMQGYDRKCKGFNDYLVPITKEVFDEERKKYRNSVSPQMIQDFIDWKNGNYNPKK